jgi:hypothetical protein
MLLLIKLLQACVFATFGKLYASWFMRTKAGKWTQSKIDKFMFYLAVKYDIEVAKKEAKWKRDYPELAKRIDKLEEQAHPPILKGSATELSDRIGYVEARLKMYSQYPNE